MSTRICDPRWETWRQWIRARGGLGPALTSGSGRAIRALGGLPWLPAIVGLFAFRALIARMHDPLGPYDEGLLFTDAYLLTRGQVLYKDFYANYPPGIFQLVRAVLALGVPAIWTTRMIALIVRVLSAICAGCLVHKTRGQRGFCAWTAASILVLQEGLGLTLYAYPVAVLCAQAVMLRWPTSSASARCAALSPFLLGLVSYVRHDLFVYAVLGMTGLEAGSWLLRRRSFFTDSRAAAARFVAVSAATLGLLWLPVLLRSGWHDTLHDLVLDQAQRVMPGRVLPTPALFGSFDIGALATPVPALLGDRTAQCVALGLLGAGSALLALMFSRQSGGAPTSERARILALLGIFSLAALPQALQRTDYHHAVYGVPLALAAIVASFGLARPLLFIVLLPWFAHAPAFARWDVVLRALRDRGDEHFTTQQRREIVALVQSTTRADEPLFVGCTSHQRVMMSPVDLLYLSRRKNATRYVQFDPGTVTRADKQAEMIEQLERTRPSLAILEPGCFWNEPNASQLPGATLLDEYLARQYAPVDGVSGMAVWRRR